MTRQQQRRQQWVYPAGSCSRHGHEVVIDGSIEGWRHTGLTVLTLAPQQSHTWELVDQEAIVIPLSGGCSVLTVDMLATDMPATDGSAEHRAELAGRDSVFAGSSDIAYVPAGSRLTITGSDRVARIALATAVVPSPASGDRAPFRYVPAAQIPVELRGSGHASREVRNFGTPQNLDAGAIIACEVITPGGNYSSYPPHKHDVERAGVETELEEIYYFEVQTSADAPPTAAGADPIGYQRVYASDERPIDVLAEVRSGDVVLVPYGWHGPAMALPGYDLYYLNVMAGPGPERAWLICDDPAHGWVREQWPDQPMDPRLPLGHPGSSRSESGPVGPRGGNG